MDDNSLYRNGDKGIYNGSISVNATKVAYPVAFNYANNCDIKVCGDHMHRCVYLCGDNNVISAKGRNYYATDSPAHVLLLSNVLKDSCGNYKIVTCNHNNVTYTQMEGETKNLQEGSVFQYQNLRFDLNEKVPHADYSFLDNTINIYCCKVGGNNIQYLYKSFASNWEYDKTVTIECVINVNGDISSYLSYSSFVFFANTKDTIIINNNTDQEVTYMFSYSGNSQSIYEINGNSQSISFGTANHPFKGTVWAKGNKVYVNTLSDGSEILGEIYLEGDDVEVVQNVMRQCSHIHIMGSK